jgi:hypothetical protein
LIGALGGVALVTACTIPPPGKNLAIIQQEDVQCRSYAAATIGALPPGQATSPTAASPASNATAAAAGPTIGGAAGYAGNIAAGATYAASSAYDVHTRYDIGYTQCIYSSGNAILPMPTSDYAFAGEEYPWYGDPWFEWAGLGPQPRCGGGR